MNVYQNVHDQLFTLMFEVRSRMAKIIKENQYDLAHMHHKALAILYHCPGATQQDLAIRTGRDKSQISRLIKELECKNLIQRTQDEDDRRVVRLALNEKGLTVFKELRLHETKLIQSILEGFTATEIEILDATLVRMRENLHRL